MEAVQWPKGKRGVSFGLFPGIKRRRRGKLKGETQFLARVPFVHTRDVVGGQIVHIDV